MTTLLTRPGCSSPQHLPLTSEERARLDAMIIPAANLVEVEARVLRNRYLALPLWERQWVYSRLGAEIGWSGLQVLLDWEHWEAMHG